MGASNSWLAVSDRRGRQETPGPKYPHVVHTLPPLPLPCDLFKERNEPDDPVRFIAWYFLSCVDGMGSIGRCRSPILPGRTRSLRQLGGPPGARPPTGDLSPRGDLHGVASRSLAPYSVASCSSRTASLSDFPTFSLDLLAASFPASGSAGSVTCSAPALMPPLRGCLPPS